MSASGKTKRQLIEDAVGEHLSDEGLVLGCASLREQLPEVLTSGEAAALLRIEEPRLREASKNGEVPGRVIAGEWRYSRAALLEWLSGR